MRGFHSSSNPGASSAQTESLGGQKPGTAIARAMGMATRFNDRPFIAIWEMTRACDLVCKHCRASAVPKRCQTELSTREAEQLLTSFAEGGVPLVVLTGGDPAKRPDLVHLVRYGRALGLSMGLTPSATPLVTDTLVAALCGAGLSRLAISIDGRDAETHDAFRGIPGSFEHSLRILGEARRHGVATQVNTTLHAGSLPQLEAISKLVGELQTVLWSVFYIVPTGRADAAMLPSAEAVECSLERLADIAEVAPFAVKTTAAPHYRRVVLGRKRGRKPVPVGVHRRGAHVNDGRGFVFVSHEGDIYPSGFLPIACGNVRRDDVLDIYRHHETFVALRDEQRLEGKCGACEYSRICSGSRARAAAMSDGNMFASDPLCAYVPPGYSGLATQVGA